jgi:hypothetical protein
MVDTNGSILATRGIYSISAARDGTIQVNGICSGLKLIQVGLITVVELALPETLAFCYGRNKTSTSMTVLYCR